MTNTVSATKGVPIDLQAAGSSSGNGTVIAIPSSFKNHKIIIKGSAGIASGSIQPETADVFNYSGTWAPIGGGPVNAVASSEVEVTWQGNYQFLRARISANIVGGTVQVIYVGS